MFYLQHTTPGQLFPYNGKCRAILWEQLPLEVFNVVIYFARWAVLHQGTTKLGPPIQAWLGWAAL